MCTTFIVILADFGCKGGWSRKHCIVRRRRRRLCYVAATTANTSCASENMLQLPFLYMRRLRMYSGRIASMFHV
jgi:hypothetical protein